MDRKFSKSIDKQKSIARKGFSQKRKDIMKYVWITIRYVFFLAIYAVLVYKIPIWIGELLQFGEMEVGYIYLAELFLLPTVISGLYYWRITNEMQGQPLKENSELEQIKKCMYCGKQLVKRLDINNPEDFGLHTPYLDFSGKVVCTECDFVVTQTDRLLKAIIDGEDRERDIKLLEEHISYFPVIFEKNN